MGYTQVIKVFIMYNQSVRYVLNKKTGLISLLICNIIYNFN